jgi:hypothetical protein
MHKKIIHFVIVVLFLFISSPSQQFSSSRKIIDIKPPESFTTDTFPSLSFSSFLQNLPVSDSSIIRDHRRQIINSSFYNVLAVVNIPLLFNDDLEQCADFAMRLRAEYYKTANKLDGLYLFDYNGNKQFYKTSGLSYEKFLRKMFANSNSYSLKKGCIGIAKEELRPGDLIVQNVDGGIGHVSVIVNSCTSKKGQRLFLIGYSFMPAQQFHIEHAGSYGMDGWFTLDGYIRYLKDNLDYGEPVLRRF